MKKIFFTLLIIIFMLPLSGEKKMDIIHSVWMISHPVFEDVSCINPETGELNEPRAEYFVQIAENCGATGMRFLPGLLIDYKIFPGAKLKGYNYLPWEWTGEGFDLSRQNPIYKALLAGTMVAVAALSLVVDHFYKKIKKLKKQEVKNV